MHLFRACDAEAIREPYEDMISRVSSFGRYLSLGLDGIEFIAYSNSICKNEKDGNHDVRAFDEEAKLSPKILGSTSNSCLWWRSFSKIPSFWSLPRACAPKRSKFWTEGTRDLERFVWWARWVRTWMLNPRQARLCTSQPWYSALCQDPFQFNFILSVPGQTVALHLDAPYFFGATRFQVPQWLPLGRNALVFQKSLLFEVRSISLPCW